MRQSRNFEIEWFNSTFFGIQPEFIWSYNEGVRRRKYYFLQIKFRNSWTGFKILDDVERLN